MVKRGPHEAALKHQRRSAAMQYYVGLDVSVKETSVCIVDKAGKVMREVKVATKSVAILAVLTEEGLAIERIGLEAGPQRRRRPPHLPTRACAASFFSSPYF